jgi:CBS domain containing-hemolysin-like protein
MWRTFEGLYFVGSSLFGCASRMVSALASMRRTNAHLARTFSESGRTTGVLFLEDIIEELVGEVQDATRRL